VVLAARRWTTPVSSPPLILDAGLEVRRGELVVVVGGPGAGATLLLRSLAGLADAHGELWLGTVELTGASAAGRARAGLGFVPQDGGVVDDLTVAEHLSLGRPRRLRRGWSPSRLYRVFPSLGQARHRPARALPPLERRCLALARSLVLDPAVLLVDRAAHGLSDRAAPVVLDALVEVAEEAAVVVTEAPGGPALALGGRVVELDGGILHHEFVAGRAR
jgi:branched-chain amino acid transport system ATP-binding protein